MPEPAPIVKVYDANDVALHAFLLRQGELVFALDNTQIFSLKGENIIFGAAEVLYGLEHNTMDTRAISVYTRGGSTITDIPNTNLRKFITLYNIGYNITRVAARTVQKTNELITSYNERFMQENNHSKKHYIKYFDIITALEKMGKDREVPRVNAFVKLKKQTLAYRKGSLFAAKHKTFQSILGRRIDDFKTEFSAGSVICKQNDPAADLFVLNKGQIRVLLGSEEVAHIDQPGSIFGEMSLFLNEPRSATLVAASNTIVTVIGRESLPTISGRMPEFFSRITSTLWSRLKTNIEMIQAVKNLKPDSARTDLKELQNALTDFMKGERIFWIKSFINELDDAT